MTTANLIRAVAKLDYIDPARTAGRPYVTIRAGDLAAKLRLHNRVPAVCSALTARKFETFASVRRTAAVGPGNGCNLYLTFKLL